MIRRNISRTVVATATVLLHLAPGAFTPEAAGEPYVYVSPTAGIWEWDEKAAYPLELEDGSAFVWGGRAGYSPIEAFAGEIVVLTGSNDAVASGGTTSLRLTQIELSLVVNFQTLVSSPVYPFLDLGGGVALRRGAEEEDGPSPFDDSRFVFHLGGGLKADLGTRLGLRFNLRDTFFTDSQGVGNEENQVTVDSVEISVGLEYRLPVDRGGGPRRLR